MNKNLTKAQTMFENYEIFEQTQNSFLLREKINPEGYWNFETNVQIVNLFEGVLVYNSQVALVFFVREGPTFTNKIKFLASLRETESIKRIQKGSGSAVMTVMAGNASGHEYETLGSVVYEAIASIHKLDLMLKHKRAT